MEQDRKGRVSGWSGVFVPFVTPFTEQGKIDAEAFRSNIERLIDDGVHGIIPSASCGEAYVLTMSERKQLFKLAVEQIKGRVKAIAGTSAIRTEDVIELNEYAYDIGMDGAMIVSPYYALPDEREVIAHYETISKSVSLPIMLYNNPGRTNVDLTPDIVDKLADLENVVAIKDSSKDLTQIIETIRKCGDRIAVFIGRDSLALPGLIMGAKGTLAMLAQVMGKEEVDLYSLAVSGRIEEARRIQYRISALWEIIFKGVGTPYPRLKEAMNLVGRPAGSCRRPMLPLESSEREDVRKGLEALGLVR